MANFKSFGTVLAIDPGKTTGMCVWQAIDGQFLSWERQYSHVGFVDELNRFWPEVIVCESFVHTNRDNVDYTPVEFIGLVKWFIERSAAQLIEQTSSYGKGYFTNDKLKKLNLYKAGKGHAMDATRHLLQYLMTKNALDLNLLK